MDEEEKEGLTKRERRELRREEKRLEEASLYKKDRQRSLISKALVLVVLALVAWVVYSFFKTPASPAPTNIEITDSDWIKGGNEAKLTLVEYGDFQCPACGFYYPVVKKISDDFDADLKVVFRHLPLAQHKNAMSAAKAAEAAGRQGKFWEMHDMLFGNQDEWSDLGNPKDQFVSYANDLGLDRDRFLSDFEDKSIEEKIAKDVISANALRVTATPTFFLNGVKLPQIKNYEDFKAKIEAGLAN